MGTQCGTKFQGRERRTATGYGIEASMATYQQDDGHDRITHMDVLNLLRQDMREGFAQQREAINARLDGLESKVDAVDDKVERHFADHAEQANESKTGRRWLIGIAIGVGIAVAGFLGQYLPGIIRGLQSGS